MTERLVPQIFRSHLVEQETASKEKETARVQNVDPHACPICGSMLVNVVANGHNVLACMQHNIVMPVQDQ